MNAINQNREIVISRVKKELIGPGSDLFDCNDSINFFDEVIEGKPLQRYFSGILFPKQLSTSEPQEDDDENEEILSDLVIEDSPIDSSSNIIDPQTPSEDNKEEVHYSANTFFPSQYGISFGVSKDCPEIKITISFGNYKKAKLNEIALPYDGDSIELFSQFGLDMYVFYDKEKGLLKLTKELSKDEKVCRDKCLHDMAIDHKNSGLYKAITKLFFKDKYKRHDNKIAIVVPMCKIQESENCHYKVLLSSDESADTESWWKGRIGGEKALLKDNLWLHAKLYNSNEKTKFIIKLIIENSMQFPKTEFSLAKEKLNQICLFQTEIKVQSHYLIPFNDYKDNLYKSGEDKMLDYLYREKLAYGIGHNTSCEWENCEDDKLQPTWVASTFLPQYNVKSQSTDIEKIDRDTLEIKKLSSFNVNKKEIISNLNSLSKAYAIWIDDEIKCGGDNELALTNTRKCSKIKDRIDRGIELLKTNDIAFRSFQLANSAIYLQMFQNELHFSSKKEGFETFERNEDIQYSYEDYGTKAFPNSEREPVWRPFQLAFILQTLPSFIDENSEDRELVDLLYFPTGGGKTEAYLAVSAFLIFWRRLQYPTTYGGVNVIIRYTLRLLSAQQFERATKLILACEFIRQNQSDLGDERITIGFWVGGSTIPNKITDAERELTKTIDRLNKNQSTINPFQVSSCQWCNTKMICRVEPSNLPVIGHRINRKNELVSYCLNPKCNYSEEKNGLPIVLVDEDIYKNPPTMLFATVDKFAQLAWKGEATSLFNHKEDRKPELIIQDELHLLTGPLGSLVGLFENLILSLSTTEHQIPKIIASTATVKNVDAQIFGLYGRNVQIFPQNATNADDTFFSKTQITSKRRYIGVLPTGKTFTMANLRLNAALFYARLEIWEETQQKADADQFWTVLSYFKSLKNIGRFSNKIVSELIPEIKQLQVRYFKNQWPYYCNYNRLSHRNLELTSRIRNDQLKKNLDKLSVPFDGSLETYQSFDLVLATNMISVGLDVSRLGLMLMNGMPSNTAEYIQASSRVARKNEGVVITLFDPNNTRDLSYFEDFISFHKTFYKHVEPLCVTPFAENALYKMMFTLIVAFFRHKMGYTANNMANALDNKDVKASFLKGITQIFEQHPFLDEEDKMLLNKKLNELIQDWECKIQASPENGLFYYGGKEETQNRKNLLIPIQERHSDTDIRVAMQSMRSVEPNAIINIKKY